VIRGALVARRHHRGQNAVEMALVLPVVIFVIIGVVEFSRAMFVRSVVYNAAREGARYAILHPTDETGIANAAKRYAHGLKKNQMSVSVSYPDDTTEKDDRVRVTVTYSLQTVIPGIPSINLKGVATMRIE